MYEAMRCAMDGSYQKAVTCSTETRGNHWSHLCMSSLKKLCSVLQSITLFTRLTQQETGLKVCDGILNLFKRTRTVGSSWD